MHLLHSLRVKKAYAELHCRVYNHPCFVYGTFPGYNINPVIGHPKWGNSWFSSVPTGKCQDIILRKLAQAITFLILYPRDAQFKSRLEHWLYRLIIFVNFLSPRTQIPINNTQNYIIIFSFPIHYSLLFNCSCNSICIVFIVCSVSFIVYVVLCAVFCLSMVCYFVWYVLSMCCVLL
jgi:hypothetical protein